MPASRRTPWLLCYDIADPRRLQRVHRVARRHATPLQYSVFHTIATRGEVRAMIHDIEEFIDPGQDDVRAYPLLTTAQPVTLGRSRLANGVMLCHPTSSKPSIGHLHVDGQPAAADRIVSKGIRRRCFHGDNGGGLFKPQT